MIHGGTRRILCEKGRAVTKSWSAVEHLKILLMVLGVTRFMCEKGRAVTTRWSAVEHRELIAGGGN